MVSKQKTLKFSAYSGLYDILVKPDNIFRRLHDDIDFVSLTNVLLSTYSDFFGRYAYPPDYMFKLCLLKVMTDLSDIDLVEEVNVNMAYKYFLDMSPEEMTCHPSTLCVFRRNHIGGTDLLGDLVMTTFRFAEEAGIKTRVNGKFHVRGIIDATHMMSLYGIHRPVPVLKEQSKKLRRALYETDGELAGRLAKDRDIAATDLTAEMVYCKGLLACVEQNFPACLKVDKVRKAHNRLKELVDDIAEYYSYDPDAGLGHKSADTEFFGYKATLLMDADTGLVTAAAVTSGEVGDALPGMEVAKEVIASDDFQLTELSGDTAYSGQPFLDLAASQGFDMLTTPHPLLGTGIDGRDGFTFNKDADLFCCPAGHLATGKRTVTYKKDNNRTSIIYRFSPQHCATCPLRETCLGKAREKTFSVSRLTPEQQKLLSDSQSPEYRRRRKERYKIEALNSHLKSGYAFRKAQGKGKEMMTLQAAIAIFAYNMKKIYATMAKK